jgi:predicted nucleotidyltransferase
VGRTMVLPCLDLESNIRIDFISSFSPYDQEALKRVVRIPIGRAEVCFASIEDLIIHKLIAGRPRDLEDIRNVLLRYRTLDIDYIHHWLGEFDASLNEPFVRQFDEIRQSIIGS